VNPSPAVPPAPVYPYIFTEHPSAHADGRIYGLGGVPALTYAEGVELAQVANAILARRREAKVGAAEPLERTQNAPKNAPKVR
jgi:hypothetical protein